MDGSLKLGRVSKRIEKAVGETFDADVSVYMGKDSLNEFARKYPESYLRKIEAMADLLKRPDYAAYDAEGKDLFLIKEYIREGSFRKVVMRLHRGERWEYASLGVLGDLEGRRIDASFGLKRVEG
jgi:hypothetical protein